MVSNYDKLPITFINVNNQHSLNINEEKILQTITLKNSKKIFQINQKYLLNTIKFISTV